MPDLPENTDLLAVVADFLRSEIGPELEGNLFFQTRVAANVLDMVRRDLEQPAEAALHENRCLEELLQTAGDTRELTRQLCERIAAGDIGPDTPGFVDYLWFSTCNKLAVDQPRYAGYRHVLEQRSPRKDG